MSAAKTCDYDRCGMTFRPDDHVSFEVHQPGPAYGFGVSNDWDFCSVDCLSMWALARNRDAREQDRNEVPLPWLPA